MLVIIGCEESGTARDKFIRAGHNAFSCDIEAGRGEFVQNHIRQDIVELLNGFDDQEIDLAILHPDCTAVCNAGNRHYASTEARQNQIRWILALWMLAKRKAKRVALENPASVIWPYMRKEGATVQFVQPWQFGHLEAKKTGFALHNLPELQEENNVYDKFVQIPIAERERVWYMAPGPNRKRDRSKTYEGIADAFVNQWGIF
jgi:hypothetical protein